MIKVKNYNDHAELYIYGVIIDDTDAAWLQAEKLGSGYEWPDKIKSQLASMKGLPVDVHIASDGGNVAAGIAIFNMLKNHDADVTVYVDSWAASIASVIAFAGKKIIMPANTFLMIHNPSGCAHGDASYLRSVADWLDKLQNMIAETYANATEKATVEEIKELMDKETWLTAAEAAEMFGKVELVDANDIEAVACYKSGFKSAPESLHAVKDDAPQAIDNNAIDNKTILSVLQEAYKL